MWKFTMENIHPTNPNQTTNQKYNICKFYNIQHQIEEYTTTEEYQQQLCKLYNIENTNDFEQNYNKIVYVQKIIYKHTKNIPEFKTLYELASATVLSTKLKFGISILFSYHYLPYFHYCLQTYFLQGKNAFNTHCNSYICCYNILRPKNKIETQQNVL